MEIKTRRHPHLNLRSESPSSVTLRRHNTAPSPRVIIAPVSIGRNIARQTQHRLTMKSNPYVGWFRHSPPTTRLTEKWKRQQQQQRLQKVAKMQWYSMPSSLPSCKNSPHIGWFRHAPPSRLDLGKSPSTAATAEEEQLLLKLLEELTHHHQHHQYSPAWMDLCSLSQSNKLQPHQQHFIISGRLPGGGKEYLEGTRRHSTHTSSRFVQDLLQESSREGTLNTVNALSRLASWFLFPVAHDAESCGYHQYGTGTGTSHSKKRRHKSSRKREEGLMRHLSPYLPTFLDEAPPRQEKYARFVTTTAEDHNDAHYCDNDDESDGSDCDSVASSLTSSPPVPQNLNCSKDLSLSVSSLAEAYYAHHATTKDLVVSSSPEIPRATTSAYDESPLNPHRLDYDITQMDIARMTRNAARHLDVQSIMSLPVITYQKGVTIKSPKQPQAEGWSWTMVEEVSVPTLGEEIVPELGSNGSNSQQQGEIDFCVICLEHFANGDRLRVLPCDHSFHVGCIDRWLSGSQSFEECYTSGCPTCKKHPTIDRSHSLCEPIDENPRRDVYRSGSLDGSVPSWAFAQIGSALLAQQDQA